MRQPPQGSGPARSPSTSTVALTVALMLGGLAGRSAAQEGPLGSTPVPATPEAPAPAPATPPPAPPIGGFEPRLPSPPIFREIPPPPSIVDGLGEARASIEIKVGQGRFLTLREDLVIPNQPASFLAVGDPSVADFFQVGPRSLRLIGKRLGTTDLSITTGSGKTYDYEIQVVADLDVLRVQLRQMFPDAALKLGQIRERVVIEGQARDAAQVNRIVATVEAYVRSIQRVQVAGQVGDVQFAARMSDPNAPPPAPKPASEGETGIPVGPLTVGAPTAAQSSNGSPPIQGSPGAIAANSIATNQVQVINLIRVPTSQQVMLKVRVAELNRTAFRQIGGDFFGESAGTGSLFGTQIAGNGFSGTLGATSFPRASFNPNVNPLLATTTITQPPGALTLGSQATLFGTFNNGAFNTVLTALRRNNLLKILAEPNLVALNGHQANFLAGGEFPVPSFSGVGSGGSGGGGASSTQFKEFGVRLAFLPIIQDNETIRLTVDPEVSTVDFSVATTLVPGGSPVPGLNKRSSHTTVELKQGETLAIAGLMQLTLDGATQRIPLFGDLPFIGPFFSNTSGSRVEKELVILVTPYIIEPMAPGQVPPGPGEEVVEPNDLEFFLLNRIEGRTGIDRRSTTSYDDPLHLIRHSLVERKYLIGPSGYSK